MTDCFSTDIFQNRTVFAILTNKQIEFDEWQFSIVIFLPQKEKNPQKTPQKLKKPRQFSAIAGIKLSDPPIQNCMTHTSNASNLLMMINKAIFFSARHS